MTRGGADGRRWPIFGARELTKNRRFRDLAKAWSFAPFLLCDRLGFHVLPKHYYSPVPDYLWLRRNRKLWTAPARLEDVFEWDLGHQLAWLTEVCAPFYREVEGLGIHRTVTEAGAGIGFGAAESQVLHCFIRSFAPRQIIEIGSGLSTAFMLHAIGLNVRAGRDSTRLICVEPNPREALRATKGIELIEHLCQEMSLSSFRQLRSGDLLFIDSTHSVKTGSDVIRIYLEIIPSLAPGVFVHAHDINFPFRYPRDALSGFWGAQETAILMALLIGNRRLEVLASLSALHYQRSVELQKLLSDYRPEANDEGLRSNRPAGAHFPSSIWLRTN